MKKHNGKLDHTYVYKECHTLKDEKRKGKWISKKAKRIMVSIHTKIQEFLLKSTHRHTYMIICLIHSQAEFFVTDSLQKDMQKERC